MLLLLRIKIIKKLKTEKNKNIYIFNGVPVFCGVLESPLHLALKILHKILQNILFLNHVLQKSPF